MDDQDHIPTLVNKIARLEADLREREERIVSLHERLKSNQTEIQDLESFRSREKQEHQRDVSLLLAAIKAFGGH
jgi:septal ring factor EnvC (AmiA/AmiB activator)